MTPFETEEFKQLSPKQKKEFIINEFLKCKQSFEYFISNYVFIRHKSGILKIQPFDFQLDIAIPLSYALQYGRTKEALEKIREYKFKFDYNKWKEYVEKHIELSRSIPEELHDFYLNVVTSPVWQENIDIIILKSRQTGISTIMQIVNVWHVNFYDNVQHLVVSYREKEAKEYMEDVQRIWQLIPVYIRAQKMKMNVHELAVSITGSKERQSVVASFTSSPDVARGYTPNLLVLDEFASYKNVDALWSAIVGSMATGGIMVIISTPKGVGNLFYELWSVTKQHCKNISIHVDARSNFKPYVVHWSQLPEEEFIRRGFSSGYEWYQWMRGYLVTQGGEQKASQELDLEFITSGNTALSPECIKVLKSRPKLDTLKRPEIITSPPSLKGVRIYERPQVNKEYMIGVDVAEGTGKDYSSVVVLQLPSNVITDGLPKIVAEYRSNIIKERDLAELVITLAKLYNFAYLNIESNNSGKVVIEYVLDRYPQEKVLNTYRVSKSEFIKNQKGWDERSGRKYLTTYLIDFIEKNKDSFDITDDIFNELLTFINVNGKYIHSDNSHDDMLFALGLALVGYELLPKYKQFLGSSSILPQQLDDLLYSTELIHTSTTTDTEDVF